ncbi:hypothetical protein RFI_33764 [Reticulomyxa filosa]|uniref:Uncharacterized protein n=1 Tax=Reticulomyxa filosa TaxID=46433 RepID=X6LSB3_RETFI|nr:hypothetical protein RFI_33764 [Reticulomyxa filosa]|eukprot:ETO03640.1 hypothetical protein RFI_33764 [Reticulomyxa filosa]
MSLFLKELNSSCFRHGTNEVLQIDAIVTFILEVANIELSPQIMFICLRGTSNEIFKLYSRSVPTLIQVQTNALTNALIRFCSLFCCVAALATLKDASKEQLLQQLSQSQQVHFLFSTSYHYYYYYLLLLFYKKYNKQITKTSIMSLKKEQEQWKNEIMKQNEEVKQSKTQKKVQLF